MVERLIAALLVAASLAGCGLTVPNISEPWDQDIPPNLKLLPNDKLTATAQIEFEIKKRVYCDLKNAVLDAEKIYYGEGKNEVTRVKNGFLPLDWGAETSLSLQVDEAITLNPGVTITQVMPNAIKAFGVGNTVTTPQSFNFGFGGNLSSTATTIDKFDSYYTIDRLNKKIEDVSICNPDHPQNDPFYNAGVTPATSTPFVVESELGIKDWLIGALYSTRAIPSDPMSQSSGSSVGTSGGSSNASQGSGNKQEPDTLTREIKFIIVSTGNVTPTWKLVRVSANTGMSSFFGLGRTRTHDLIITIGPPNAKTLAVNSSQQIGNAVSNANRATLTTPSGLGLGF